MQSLSRQLDQLLGSLPSFLPEAGLTVLFIGLIVGDLILPKAKAVNVRLGIAFVGLIIIGYLVYRQYGMAETPPMLFLDMLRLDRISIFFKFIFIIAGLAMLLLSVHESTVRERGSGEYVSIMIAMLLGLHLMAMSVNLLMLYLALELVSISSYILATFAYDKKSAEGSLKYILFGATSSGVMLYGMSLLYGFTGTLALLDPAFAAGIVQASGVPLLFAFFLTLGGLLFKISAFPFHVWTPDVYQSAPTPVVAFFSVAPKAAAMLVIARLFYTVFPTTSPVLATSLWAVIAALTLAVGNLSALWQTNAKRLLAYSSIAHAGFLLIGIIALNTLGWQSVLFYAAVFLLMNIAAFALITFTERRLHTHTIADFAGIGLRHPLLGIAFTVVMIALTGLPPTAGFTAKLFVFSALWQAYQQSDDPALLFLFLWGLLNVVIALVYYLKIPFVLFFRPGIKQNFAALTGYEQIVIGLFTVPLLMLFFKADWLMNWIAQLSWK